MIAALQSLAAIMLAGIILTRVICVLYQTNAPKHRSTALFLGFGYSYVLLGAGGIFGAVALCSDHDMGDLALWLMLAGSVGLIVFDRRAAKCWSVTDCPLGRDGWRR